MAEDKLNDIMQSWDTMDIGELGSSLLQRKGDIAKASAKAAKKDERIAMAMGVLMAGQALYKNQVNNRQAELNKIHAFDQAQATAQAPAIQKMADLYGVIDNFEKEEQARLGDENFKLTAENYMDYWDNDSQYAEQLKIQVMPAIEKLMTGVNFEIDGIKTPRFKKVQNQILPAIVENMMKNREGFRSGLTQLFGDKEGAGVIMSYEDMLNQATGLTVDELKIIKAKKMSEYKSQYDSQGRKLFNLNNIRNGFKALGRVEEQDGVPDTENIYKKIELFEEGWEDTVNNLSIDDIIQTQISRVLSDPSNQDWIPQGQGTAFTDERTEIENLISGDKLDDLSREGFINVGMRKRGGSLTGFSAFNQLENLSDELSDSSNIKFKTQFVDSATGIVARLTMDDTFNRAFFNSDTVITDKTDIRNAAVAYTIGTSVKPQGGLGQPWFSTEKVFGGNNFEYDFDTVNRTLNKHFSIKDGQFIAEQAWFKLKDVDRLGAVQDEIKSIVNNTKYSKEQKEILTARLVDDIGTSKFVFGFEDNEGMALTNQEIVDLINAGVDVEDAFRKFKEGVTPEKYGTRRFITDVSEAR